MLEYALIFALLALAGFGLPVPEESALLLAALYISQGSSIAVMAAFCVLGIALADTGQYLRGRVASAAFAKFKHGKYFLQQTGFFAIVASRFFISTRTVLPYMAGALRMPKFRFHVASIVSAVLATAVYLLLGKYVLMLVALVWPNPAIPWAVLLVIITGTLIMFGTRSQMQLSRKS